MRWPLPCWVRSNGDAKPIYANPARHVLFFESGRGGWQIGRDIGPHATVAASASKGAVEAADSCPEKAGPYYALRSKALGWDRQVAITMRCLDNIATRDAAATSAAEHGEAAPAEEQQEEEQQPQGPEQPAEPRAAVRGHCCAVVEVHRLRDAGPERPGAYSLDPAADAADRARLTGTYHMLVLDGRNSSERPIYRSAPSGPPVAPAHCT